MVLEILEPVVSSEMGPYDICSHNISLSVLFQNTTQNTLLVLSAEAFAAAYILVVADRDSTLANGTAPVVHGLARCVVARLFHDLLKVARFAAEGTPCRVELSDGNTLTDRVVPCTGTPPIPPTTLANCTIA